MRVEVERSSYRIDVYRDPLGEYRWRLWLLATGELSADSAKTYTSPGEAYEDARELVETLRDAREAEPRMDGREP